jgi:hypothetical protein
VVPEPVDVHFFDPAHTEAATLPLEGASLVLGPKRETALTGTSQPAGEAAAACALLSVFKWEARKGWDVLVRQRRTKQTDPLARSQTVGEGCIPNVQRDARGLVGALIVVRGAGGRARQMRAYVKEFSAGDPVALYILSNAYHTKKQFARELRRIAAAADDAMVATGAASKRHHWPRVFLIQHHVPTVALPALYKAMHALVQVRARSVLTSGRAQNASAPRGSCWRFQRWRGSHPAGRSQPTVHATMQLADVPVRTLSVQAGAPCVSAVARRGMGAAARGSDGDGAAGDRNQLERPHGVHDGDQ